MHFRVLRPLLHVAIHFRVLRPLLHVAIHFRVLRPLLHVAMHFRVLRPLLHVAVLPQEDGLFMFSCHCGRVYSVKHVTWAHL